MVLFSNYYKSGRIHKILWLNSYLLESKLPYNYLSHLYLYLAKYDSCLKQVIAFYGPVFMYERI